MVCRNIIRQSTHKVLFDPFRQRSMGRSVTVLLGLWKVVCGVSAIQNSCDIESGRSQTYRDRTVRPYS